VLARVRAIVATDLRPLARTIDQDALYPERVLRSLGRAGAFAQHCTASGGRSVPDVGAAIEAMALVGEECLSTAFCTWCQDACGWYLENTENASARALLQPDVAAGRLLAGSGLSNPLKAISGIEKLRLTGRPCAGGFAVSGTLPWISNLRAGHIFGIAFAVAGDPGRMLMALARVGDEGVVAERNAEFIALEGTETRAVRFTSAFIPDAMVLADPIAPFLRRSRAGFVLLQIGMALGLIRGCIALMQREMATFRHVNAYLPDGPETIGARLLSLTETTRALAATPSATEEAYLEAVLRARLEASELSLAAAQAAMLHGGARAYLKGSPFNRRLREAYFVALVTPATKHLRRDLAASARDAFAREHLGVDLIDACERIGLGGRLVGS
jgi:alkylation response protein AidB-like acyl-CoA dehydrogenase